MTIKRDSLLCKLSHIVKDDAIMELVGQFLYLPILDKSGRDFTADIGSIPTSGLITDVLLHFTLTEFDKEFQRLFPGLYYNRYVHEVFVSFPNTNTLDSEGFFEVLVLNLFDRLNLNLGGKILSIVPGDAPIPCYGGIVSVSQDGVIQFQVKEKKEL